MDDKSKAPAGISRSEFMRGAAVLGLAGTIGVPAAIARAQDAPPVSPTSSQPKPATPKTIEVNNQYRQGLPFDDIDDFEFASRGKLAALPEPVQILNDEGRLPATAAHSHEVNARHASS